MNISVVIATLNRTKDLKTLFDSMVDQTKLPWEIIIIDQSDDSATLDMSNNFADKLPVKYHHCSIKSAAYCRNLGVDKADGDIIAFLDDDTKLMPDYMESIERFYSDYPNALGGMARIINHMEFREKLFGKGFIYLLYKLLSVFFGLNSFKKGFLILRSSRNIECYESEIAMEAEWLSTCNSWFKKKVFQNFRFEEEFTKWSFGEDRMFSYRIFRKYPGSLYFYPGAALYHFESTSNRLPEENKILMKVIYQYWFYRQCLESRSFHFWWGNTGEILLHFLNGCIGREPIKNTWLYIKSNAILITNIDKIKKGNLNQFIK